MSEMRHTSWLVRHSLCGLFNANLRIHRRFSADIVGDDGSLQKTTYDGLVVDYLISGACMFGDLVLRTQHTLADADALTVVPN